MLDRLARAFKLSAFGFALLAGTALRADAQNPSVISGRVVNDQGTPIVGATVSLDATTYSAITNNEGRYVLSVPGSVRGPGNVTLRIIGYRLARKSVNLTGAPATLDFSMTAQVTQMEGIVVTALSMSREKSTIGTSQQTLGGEELTKVQAPNVISAMSGKVSGVTINQSGNMGGSSRIVIRGQGSILGQNQPLFILDGIPISNAGFSTASASGGRDYGTAISDLNPDDIESMNILKGPNAAALYGSRASNGAVVITTKSGRGMPLGTKVSFTSRYTSESPSVLPKFQNQYGQGFGGAFKFVDGAGGGVNDGGDESWGPKFMGQPIDQFHGKAQPWIAHPDNVKDFFRTGAYFSNTLNVTTSARGMGARISLTKDAVTGIVPNSSLAKLAGTMSASGVVKDKLTLAGSLQYVQNEGDNRTENGYTEGNPFMTFTWFGRQVDVQSLAKQYYNKAGNPYGLAEGSLYNWNENYHRNPYWQVYENTAPDSRERVIAQVSADYHLTSWLSGLVRTGSDSYRQTTEQRFARGNIDNASASYNGGFTNATNRARETNVDGILTARGKMGMLDVTANVGGNRRRNDSYANSFGTNGILVEKIYNLANAGIAPTISNSEAHSAVNSAYGSAVLTLNNLWTVEVTGRNDWSSTLPKENSSYFYPSINSSLVLSDLFPSITKNNWVSFAKIRGGFAQVGSDAGPYQLQTLYIGNTNKFGGQSLYSLSNQSANAGLKPERTTGIEGGGEVSLFSDRVTLDATYYVKRTRDQIFGLTTAPASGFSSTVINAGQITNKGFEALLSVQPVRGRNFSWRTTFNYTRNRNRVDSLVPGLKTIIIASQWGANIEAREGEPYGVLFGYGYLRDSTTGQLLLADGLPQRAASKSILGNVNPDWVGGWANELRYKNFTLNTLIDIKRGGQNFSIGNWWGTYAGILETTLKGREADWNSPGLVVQGIDQETGKPNTVNVTAEDYNHSVYPVNEAGIYNTGFAKLREVRLSWDVPVSLASRAGMSGINLSFVGRNLFTWTKFPNYDPENSTNAGNGGQGFDMGAMPTTRSLGLNLTITP